jgi:hypothetical protein
MGEANNRLQVGGYGNVVPGQGYCATLEKMMGEYGAMVELARQKPNLKHKRSNRRQLLSKKSGRSILRYDAIYVDT